MFVAVLIRLLDSLVTAHLRVGMTVELGEVAGSNGDLGSVLQHNYVSVLGVVCLPHNDADPSIEIRLFR